MLTIILGILKVIGILLLILLGIVLLVLLLLLFCPVRYRGFAMKEEDQKPKVNVNITWLLHLLHVSVVVEEESPVISIRVLGISLESFGQMLSRFRRIRKRPEEKKADEKPVSAADNADDGTPVTAEKEKKVPRIEVPSETRADGSTKNESAKFPDQGTDTAKEKKGNRLKAVGRKLGDILNRAISLPLRLKNGAKRGISAGKAAADKVSAVKAFISGQEFREAFPFVFGKLSRLLRHILPVKLLGEVLFGFSDPADTGVALAFIAPFYPFYAENVQVVPDFQKKRLSFSLKFKGRIYGSMLLYVALRLFLDHNVQIIIRKIRKKEV